MISLRGDIQYIILNKQKSFGFQIFLKTTVFNHMNIKASLVNTDSYLINLMPHGWCSVKCGPQYRKKNYKN